MVLSQHILDDDATPDLLERLNDADEVTSVEETPDGFDVYFELEDSDVVADIIDN